MNPFQETWEPNDVESTVPVIQSPSPDQESSGPENEIVFRNPPPKLSLMERLLSPQTLHWLMAVGGGMLVIGFVVWLWSVGVFENPLVVAVSMGVGNLGLLGAGLWLYKKTRYKIAGRGLTLLASLLLPLHLWFYDAQGLIELMKGDPLWLPALVCSIIYAAIARITRDSWFVYTLVGGVVMTGLLFLAGPAVGLWTLMATSTLLVVVAMLSIGAERLFLEKEGAFSRDQFGKAFFNAGHLVLFGCLTMLLGCQLIPIGSLFLELSHNPFGITGMDFNQKLWSLGILIAGMASYFYSSRIRPKVALFTYACVTVGVWAVLLTLNIFAVQLTFHGLLLVLCSALILHNLSLRFRKAKGEQEHALSTTFLNTNVVGVAAAGLSLMGLAQMITSFAAGTGELLIFADWIQVAYFVAAAFACWTLPGMSKTAPKDIISNINLFTGVQAFSMATLAAANAFLVHQYDLMILIGLILPIGLAAAAMNVKDLEWAKLFRYSSFLSLSMTIGLWVAIVGMGGIVLPSLISIAVLFAAAALSFHLGLRTNNQAFNGAGLVSIAAAIVQTYWYFEINSAYAIISSISGLGILLVGLSIIAGRLLKKSRSGLEPNYTAKTSLSVCGNALITAGVVATTLFVLSNVLCQTLTLYSFVLIASQLVVIGLGYAATRNAAWQMTFKGCGAALIATASISLLTLSNFPLVHRLELSVLVLGAILVGLGHLAWSKESGDSDDFVGVSLSLGSLLLILPMIIGLVAFRMDIADPTNAFWLYFHEVGGLLVGLSLMASGIVNRMRSTTLGGGALLAVYVGSLAFLLRIPEVLQNTSFLMMGGGALFFAAAILLSIYRDRILSLPKRVRDGKGVFKVLKWR